MPKHLILPLLIACFCSLAGARAAAEETDRISSRIAEVIAVDQPLFLSVNAGDLSSTLDFKLRRQLLLKGADLRETRQTEPDLLTEGEADPGLLLASYALRSATLVEVNLELKWETIERKSFLSYRSERKPYYTFEVKQISLPDYQLKQIDQLSFAVEDQRVENRSPAHLKWFEPALATTALASLIYLLWTTE